MHLCRTVECIASSLQFLQHCLSVFLSLQSNQPIRSPPPSPAAGGGLPGPNRGSGWPVEAPGQGMCVGGVLAVPAPRPPPPIAIRAFQEKAMTPLTMTPADSKYKEFDDATTTGSTPPSSPKMLQSLKDMETEDREDREDCHSAPPSSPRSASSQRDLEAAHGVGSSCGLLMDTSSLPDPDRASAAGTPNSSAGTPRSSGSATPPCSPSNDSLAQLRQSAGPTRRPKGPPRLQQTADPKATAGGAVGDWSDLSAMPEIQPLCSPPKQGKTNPQG